MVPLVLLPPATPFTDQVTVEFVVPLTVATNCCAAPARTLALRGATVTDTPEEGFFFLSAVFVALVAAQPAIQIVRPG